MAQSATYSGSNANIYQEEWKVKLQEELDEPTKFTEIMKVEYTTSNIIHNPYGTDMTVQSGTRGTPYTFQGYTRTDELLQITNFKIAAQVIDRADLAQTTYNKQMELAQRQGVLLKEAIESAIYADHANRTDFDNASIGGSAGSINVSPTNIDDIVRGLRREIRQASGETLLNRYGGFIVWTSADMEILEAYMQANGYQEADKALRDGSKQGTYYGGFTHYSSELLTAEHVMAGVKNVYHLGILSSTWGDVVVDPYDPSLISGISVVSRADYGIKAWTKTKPVLFDVMVTA